MGVPSEIDMERAAGTLSPECMLMGDEEVSGLIFKMQKFTEAAVRNCIKKHGLRIIITRNFVLCWMWERLMA